MNKPVPPHPPRRYTDPPRLYLGESRARRLAFRFFAWFGFIGIVFLRPVAGIVLTFLSAYLNGRREERAIFYVERR